MSNGVHTSEFWLTVLALVIGGVLTFTNHINAQEFMAIVAGTGLYSVGRGLAKTETRP